MSEAYLKVQAPQTDRVVAAIEGLRSDLTGVLGSLKEAQAAGSAATSAVLGSVVETIASGLAAVESATQSNGASLDEIRLDNRIRNAQASGRFAVA